MDDAFVTISLSEDEFDQVIEWLGDQEIRTNLGKLYDRLYEALEARDQVEEEAEDEEEVDAEDEDEDEDEFAEEDE